MAYRTRRSRRRNLLYPGERWVDFLPPEAREVVDASMDRYTQRLVEEYEQSTWVRLIRWIRGNRHS